MGGKLAGYKTYIVAGLTVLSCTAAYLDGDMSRNAAIQAIVTAVIGATLRSGINSAVRGR